MTTKQKSDCSNYHGKGQAFCSHCDPMSQPDRDMTTKHTPGPWQHNGKYAGGSIEIRSSDHWTVAAVWSQLPSETQANAHLIAAAPELLEICERFEKICAHRWRALPEDSPEKDVLRQAKQAIAKTTGRGRP